MSFSLARCMSTMRRRAASAACAFLRPQHVQASFACDARENRSAPAASGGPDGRKSVQGPARLGLHAEREKHGQEKGVPQDIGQRLHSGNDVMPEPGDPAMVHGAQSCRAA